MPPMADNPIEPPKTAEEWISKVNETATKLGGKHDLCQLTKIEKKEMLACLETRFRNEVVYTYVGDIVISVNPFKTTGASRDDVRERYKPRPGGQQPHVQLPPHIYVLVQRAYDQLRRSEKSAGSEGVVSQSILISGESGAGKTEAMKICLTYVGELASESGNSDSNVADKLRKTNPVMEAVGNAKTVRNDNSSRFGKHFDIQFINGNIVGAKTTSYLLEKPRICAHLESERNYHVFYMLCKAESDPPSSAYRRIGLSEWSEYKICKQKGTVEHVKSWDDTREFKELHGALLDVGFGDDQRRELYRMFSIVLRLGNLECIETNNGSEHPSRFKDEGLLKGCAAPEMLDVRVETLQRAILFKRVEMRFEKFDKPLEPREARVMRNSLCMRIYSLAFKWCVDVINESLEVQEHKGGCIGVLDIFGFENFTTNSFSQLCINLTNESLHKLFIVYVFELEQRVYREEGIEWEFIEYVDNQQTLDLIQSRVPRKPSLFSLLDDSCRIDRSDEQIVRIYHENFGFSAFSTCYKKPDKSSDSTFYVIHYAGEVLYTIRGFAEKNKDDLSLLLIELLTEQTGFERLQKLAKDEQNQMEEKMAEKMAAKTAKGSSRGGPAARTTVCRSFGTSLNELMERLKKTEHHYVRCLKPNQTLKSGEWQKEFMASQLAYSGMLEVTKVRKAGLNVRQNIKSFYDYFKPIVGRSMLPELQAMATEHERVTKLMKLAQIDPNKYRIGRTLVFLKEEKQLSQLEALREAKIDEFVNLLIAIIKAYPIRKRFIELRKAARTFERYYKSQDFRRALRNVKKAARIVINCFRKWRLARMCRTYQTFGLEWHSVGAEMPVDGIELTNPTLWRAISKAQERNHMVTFTDSEWATYGITGLSANHFIQVGASYFQPVDVSARLKDLIATHVSKEDSHDSILLLVKKSNLALCFCALLSGSSTQMASSSLQISSRVLAIWRPKGWSPYSSTATRTRDAKVQAKSSAASPRKEGWMRLSGNGLTPDAYLYAILAHSMVSLFKDEGLELLATFDLSSASEKRVGKDDALLDFDYHIATGNLNSLKKYVVRCQDPSASLEDPSASLEASSLSLHSSARSNFASRGISEFGGVAEISAASVSERSLRVEGGGPSNRLSWAASSRRYSAGPISARKEESPTEFVTLGGSVTSSTVHKLSIVEEVSPSTRAHRASAGSSRHSRELGAQIATSRARKTKSSAKFSSIVDEEPSVIGQATQWTTRVGDNQRPSIVRRALTRLSLSRPQRAPKVAPAQTSDAEQRIHMQPVEEDEVERRVESAPMLRTEGSAKADERLLRARMSRNDSSNVLNVARESILREERRSDAGESKAKRDAESLESWHEAIQKAENCQALKRDESARELKAGRLHARRLTADTSDGAVAGATEWTPDAWTDVHAVLYADGWLILKNAKRDTEKQVEDAALFKFNLRHWGFARKAQLDGDDDGREDVGGIDQRPPALSVQQSSSSEFNASTGNFQAASACFELASGGKRWQFAAPSWDEHGDDSWSDQLDEQTAKHHRETAIFDWDKVLVHSADGRETPVSRLAPDSDDQWTAKQVRNAVCNRLGFESLAGKDRRGFSIWLLFDEWSFAGMPGRARIRCIPETERLCETIAAWETAVRRRHGMVAATSKYEFRLLLRCVSICALDEWADDSPELTLVWQQAANDVLDSSFAFGTPQDHQRTLDLCALNFFCLIEEARRRRRKELTQRVIKQRVINQFSPFSSLLRRASHALMRPLLVNTETLMTADDGDDTSALAQLAATVAGRARVRSGEEAKILPRSPWGPIALEADVFKDREKILVPQSLYEQGDLELPRLRTEFAGRYAAITEPLTAHAENNSKSSTVLKELQSQCKSSRAQYPTAPDAMRTLVRVVSCAPLCFCYSTTAEIWSRSTNAKLQCLISVNFTGLHVSKRDRTAQPLFSLLWLLPTSSSTPKRLLLSWNTVGMRDEPPSLLILRAVKKRKSIQPEVQKIFVLTEEAGVLEKWLLHCSMNKMAVEKAAEMQERHGPDRSTSSRTSIAYEPTRKLTSAGL